MDKRERLDPLWQAAVSFFREPSVRLLEEIIEVLEDIAVPDEARYALIWQLLSEEERETVRHACYLANDKRTVKEAVSKMEKPGSDRRREDEAQAERARQVQELLDDIIQ